MGTCLKQEMALNSVGYGKPLQLLRAKAKSVLFRVIRALYIQANLGAI